MVPTASAFSESMRISTCMRMSSDSSLAAQALGNAGLIASSPFDDGSITKAYNQFYPGSSPSGAVLSKLEAIGAQALVKAGVVPPAGYTRQFEGWRFIFMSLCNSSGWIAP